MKNKTIWTLVWFLFSSTLVFADIESEHSMVLPGPTGKIKITVESGNHHDPAEVAKWPVVGPETLARGMRYRIVSFLLEGPEEAATYELELQSMECKNCDSTRLLVRANETLGRAKMVPGEYRVRSRSWTTKKKHGEWAEFINFWIMYGQPLTLYPSQGEVVDAQVGPNQSLVFEWPENNEAKFYFFKLKSDAGKTISHHCLTQTWKEQDVEAGKSYSWAVVPVVSRKECELAMQHDPVLPYSDFSVVVPNEEKKKAKIQIETDPSGSKYQFEVIKINAQGESEDVKRMIARVPLLHANLSDGEYDIKVRTIYDDETASEWSPSQKFVIHPPKPKLVQTDSSRPMESNDDLKSSVDLKWEKSPKAKFYRVMVYNSQGKLVFDGKTEKNKVKIGLPHKDTYKWQVRSYSSAHEMTAEAAPAKPEADAPGFAINEYIKINLGTAEESSPYYAWGRYITSMVNYVGKNNDYNSYVKQSLFGGEGELALGKWYRGTDHGWMTHLSMAGFAYRSQNLTYTNGGIHYGYRRVLSDEGRLRLWFGLNYQETPEVLTDAFSGTVLYSKIKSVGPEIQASYMNSFNKNFGWHVLGSYYTGLKDMGTPNGLPQIHATSYKVGVYGTYVPHGFSILGLRDHKWMLGYAYKVDDAGYRAKDTSFGPENSSTISGHYFSASIEVALDNPMK